MDNWGVNVAWAGDEKIMKTISAMLFLLLTCSAVRAAQMFMLQSTNDGKYFGPYSYVDNSKILNGNAAIIPGSNQTFKVKGFSRGIAKIYGPFDFKHGGHVVLGTSDFILITEGIDKVQQEIAARKAKAEQEAAAKKARAEEQEAAAQKARAEQEAEKERKALAEQEKIKQIRQNQSQKKAQPDALVTRVFACNEWTDVNTNGMAELEEFTGLVTSFTPFDKVRLVVFDQNGYKGAKCSYDLHGPKGELVLNGDRDYPSRSIVIQLTGIGNYYIMEWIKEHRNYGSYRFTAYRDKVCIGTCDFDVNE
jgi:hypothetical protein